MPRDASVYLKDILEAISKIRAYTEGVEREQFERDSKTLDAVLHNLEVLGEATKRVPARLRERAPEVEWRKMAGMRDMIAHVYFQVDLDIVTGSSPTMRSDRQTTSWCACTQKSTRNSTTRG
jgi:uncharacterized protein with HEPN domain